MIFLGADRIFSSSEMYGSNVKLALKQELLLLCLWMGVIHLMKALTADSLSTMELSSSPSLAWMDRETPTRYT